jgi:glyoxylase-like metal-dependent hydrolase (beta-lactamase superfamily II)
MNDLQIHTIDLHFMGRDGTIAVYLIPHSHGAILIECGPGSTVQNLISGLKELGVTPADISDVFLTHIHLDHAGAAGWFARQGAQIHVHEIGAPHLINPEKLLASAGRLYGNMMDTLWGEFIPVSPDKLTVMHDGEVAEVGGLSIQALNVPGHANHHLAYLLGDACFSGDIGGIRLKPRPYLSLPMPPPDLNLEQWRASIAYLQKYHPSRIVPTHFGIYQDASWHLQAVLDALDEVETWVEQIMPQNPTLDDLRARFIEFERSRAQKNHVERATLNTQQAANPAFMSADGIYRYWNKFRKPA